MRDRLAAGHLPRKRRSLCKPVIPGGGCTKELKEEIGIRCMAEELICNSNKAMCEAKKAEKSQYAFCEKDQ